jgi:transposase
VWILGDRWSRYCVVDSAGIIAKEDRVRTTPEALQECFGKIPPTRMIIEAGVHSPWVSRLLKKLDHQVIVANARKVRLIYESNQKNDRVDARMLTKLGRVDVSLLAPVQHRSSEAQTDLIVVRGRDALVAARTQLINAVRGMVKSTGPRLPASTTAAFATKVLPLIPSMMLKAALTPPLKSIQHLSAQIHACDQRVEELAEKKYPATKLLRQVKQQNSGMTDRGFRADDEHRIPAALSRLAHEETQLWGNLTKRVLQAWAKSKGNFSQRR